MADESTLIQSTVQRKYFVSTAWRQSSAVTQEPVWYFETLAWEWNDEKQRRGEIVESSGSYGRMAALDEHARICKHLAAKLPHPIAPGGADNGT